MNIYIAVRFRREVLLEAVDALRRDDRRDLYDLQTIGGFCLDAGHTQQDQYRGKKEFG